MNYIKTTLTLVCLSSGLHYASFAQVTLPYTQTFDAFPFDNVSFGPGAEPNPFPQGWVNLQSDVANQDWYGRSVSTGSSGTGPTADHTGGGRYVFVEDGWGNNSDVILETPQVNLTNISSAAFIYWANSYTGAGSNFNTMHLDVFHNGGWVLNIDQFGDLTTGSTWVERTVDISAYTGGIVTFRFRGNNSNQSFQHDIAIDDVSIIETVLTAQINQKDTHVVCYGDTTGYAIASAVYGSTPYSYNWSNGDTTDSVGGLAAGVYTVTITDDDSDTSTAEVTIAQNSNLTNYSSQSLLTCFGDTNGMIVIDSSNGATPFIPDCGVNASIQCSGVTNTDTVGLDSNQNANSSYPSPYGNWYYGAKHQIIYTKHDLNERGIAGPGLITSIGFNVEAFTGGATTSYTNWTIRMGCSNDSSALSTGYVSGLETVLDPVTKTAVVGWNVDILDYPFTWDGESNIVIETCFNNTGYTRNATMNRSTENFTCVRYYRADNSTVCGNITSTTGTSTIRPNTVFGHCPISTEPYQYVWSTNDTIDSIGGLAAGNYILTVTDGEQCEFVDTFTITQPDSMYLTMVLDSNVSCFGLSDGVAIAQVTGGTPNYSYLWDNATTNDTLGGLAAGTYYVTIDDGFNCGPLNDSITITQPDSLVASAMTDSNVSCNGLMDGVASVNVVGGNGGNMYTWSNAGDSSTISGIMVGVYMVTVTDSMGCSDTSSTLVTQPDSLISNAMVPTGISCFEANDGVANVITNGGTLPYTILWSNNDMTTTTANLSPGIYYVTVTDSNNCTTNDSVELSEPDLLAVTGAVTNSVCEGDEDGEVDLTVTGGTAPYNYNWSNSATTEDVSGLGAGSFVVTVTDDNGCDSIESFIVSFNNLNPIVNLGEDTLICDTASILLDAGAHDSYLWSDASTSSSLNVSASGQYSVTVMDVAGCEGNDTISIETNDCVGITENQKTTIVRFFPNPTDGFITISFESSNIGVTGYEIMDISGALVERRESDVFHGEQINLSSLAAGSYFIKFDTNAGYQIGMVSVQ